MDVILAAGCWPVTQLFRDPLDSGDYSHLSVALVYGRSEIREGSGRQYGARPSAEVFRGEFLSGRLPDVVIDVSRVHCTNRALMVYIFKQSVAGQFLALTHHARQAAIVNLDDVTQAAFAFEVQAERTPLQPYMLVPKRGQAVRSVLFLILGVTDAHIGGLKETNRGGEDFFARQPRPLEVSCDPETHQRQRGSESNHAVELVAIPNGSIFGVISILFAPFRVPADRLNVPARLRADPYALPRRWNHEGGDVG